MRNQESSPKAGLDLFLQGSIGSHNRAQSQLTGQEAGILPPKLEHRTMISRRTLLAAAASLPIAARAAQDVLRSTPPVAISSSNGLGTTKKAVELMRDGKDTVEAAVEGVALVEDDPNDTSVGYGGLPNELGVVQLDASVMHGPTMRAGAVGCLENIKNPSRVAKMVMERTDHVLLVGPGALAFAKAMGFQEEILLTERARRAWLRWKTTLSDQDDWLSDEEMKADFDYIEPRHPDAMAHRPTGTISCIALNDKREISGCTTTSGLAYKLPGRVGDSPIIGAGLYVDGEVGGCGSTGRGEAVLQSSGSRTVVENMKRGMTPAEAILDVLKRICDQTKSPRLLNRPGRPNFDVNFYALRIDGAYAGGRIYRGGRFAVNDGGESRLVDSVYLFENAR